MPHPASSPQFAAHDYTAEGSLKAGPLFWIALLFLSRHWLLLVVGFVSALLGKGAEGAAANLLFSPPHFLPGSLLAVALLAAALRRSAKGGVVERWIWRHGHLLFAGALLSDLGVLFGQLLWGGVALGLAQVAILIVDLWILIFLTSSRRLPPLFRNFYGLAQD